MALYWLLRFSIRSISISFSCRRSLLIISTMLPISRHIVYVMIRYPTSSYPSVSHGFSDCSDMTSMAVRITPAMTSVPSRQRTGNGNRLFRNISSSRMVASHRTQNQTTDTVARFDHQVTVTSVFQYWLSWIRKAVIGTAPP